MHISILSQAFPFLPSFITCYRGEAVASGWMAVSGCQAGLGILYSQEITGPSPTSPLALRFTEYGQVAGVQVSVFGSNSIGNAAQDRLVEEGFWRVSAFNASGSAWVIDVSFRDEDDMCSDEALDEPIGDRLVINQDSIAWSVPVTRDGAEADMFTSGSCMDVRHFVDTLQICEHTLYWLIWLLYLIQLLLLYFCY